MMIKGYGLRRKRKILNGKANSVSGKSKGENCQASSRDKYFARRNRSYKHRGYLAWCAKMDKKGKR